MGGALLDPVAQGAHTLVQIQQLSKEGAITMDKMAIRALLPSRHPSMPI